jgi:hypothetical protein
LIFLNLRKLFFSSAFKNLQERTIQECDLNPYEHKRMAWGGHELPKVSPGPAMPYLLGVAHPQGRRPAAVFYPLGHPTITRLFMNSFILFCFLPAASPCSTTNFLLQPLTSLSHRPIREGVSKGEEDGRRPPALRAGHPPNPQGV